MDPHGGVIRRGGQDGFEGGPDGGIKSHPAIVATAFGSEEKIALIGAKSSSLRKGLAPWAY